MPVMKSPPALRPALMFLFTASAAVIVTNLFASQPLVSLIASGFGPGVAGLVSTLTMLGYAAGLLLLVPLTDLVDNRRLVVWTLLADVAALALAALAGSPALFLVAAFGVGVASTAIQMLVPIAAFLSPEATRGRVVGNIMSGLMLGILLSRPAASLIAGGLGWRAVYAATTAPILAVAVILARYLPRRVPARGPRYRALIASMWTLLVQEPTLRRRALSAALCMACFSVFWTLVALVLAAPPFDLSPHGMALFGLAGAGGAIIAPIAGRLGDRGLTRPATAVAHMCLLAVWGLAAVAGSGRVAWGLAGLVASGLLLDMAAIADQALGRRAINMIRPEASGRMNGLFTGIFFLGGAVGSSLAGAAWVWNGWSAVCAVGAAFALVALAMDVADYVDGRRKWERVLPPGPIMR